MTQPKIFDLKEKTLTTLSEEYPTAQFFDLRPSYAAAHQQNGELDAGVAGYFPLTNMLVVYPPAEVVHQVQTSSNHHLVTPELQYQLRETPILVVGLGVGASIVSSLFQVGARWIIGCDDDLVEPTNLNRLPLGFLPGVGKAEYLTHVTTLQDPYHHCQFLAQRVTKESLFELLETQQPKIIIDECDVPAVKYQLRVEARARGLVVISAADVGSGTIQLDVEDFRGQPHKPLFHDRLAKGLVSEEEWLTMSLLQQLSFLIEMQRLPEPMMVAVEELMKGQVRSFPQEASAAAFAAASVTQAVQLVLAGKPLKPCSFFSLPEMLVDKSPYRSRQSKLKRLRKLRRLHFSHTSLTK